MRGESRPVCLITGATGALGPTVVAALARTHEIRTFSRQPPTPGLFNVPVTAFTGDIADPDAVRRATHGADAIVHLAALLHIVDPPVEMRHEYERVNVHGTRVLLDAAVSADVARVVLISTIAVYGDTGGGVLDEDSNPQPDTLYGETKLAAERLALAAERADGTPLSTVLRPAAVYGPRVKGNYSRLVEALARKRFMPIGRGTNRRTLVFDEDLASAIAVAVLHDAAPGRIYNVSDGEFHTMTEIIEAIAAGLGRRPPAWHVPVGPARAVASAASVFDRRVPRMLDTYLEDVAVESTRIQKELGFRPAFDLERGWTATVQRMRAAASI